MQKKPRLPRLLLHLLLKKMIKNSRLYAVLFVLPIYSRIPGIGVSGCSGTDVRKTGHTAIPKSFQNVT